MTIQEPVQSSLSTIGGAPACKICGGATTVAFSLPKSKRSGQPIPSLPDDCPHYRCGACDFLFNEAISESDGREIYSADYWRENPTSTDGSALYGMRLLAQASAFMKTTPDKLEILDFGCGMGRFVADAHRELGLNIWGTDINPPEFGGDRFLASLEDRRFDVILAVEVIEHLPDPRSRIKFIFDHLKPGGVFAFQTAAWDPRVYGREWWYLGPANGHVSLYSEGALDRLSEIVGVSRRTYWNSYPGIQIWQRDKAPDAEPGPIVIGAAELRHTDIGKRDSGAITEARPHVRGTLVFGPYCTLQPGRYRAVVLGQVEGRYDVEFCRGMGAVTLGGGTISERSSSIDVDIMHACYNFECVIKRRSDSRKLWLEGIALHRLSPRSSFESSPSTRSVLRILACRVGYLWSRISGAPSPPRRLS